jgi:hypothetical protein
MPATSFSLNSGTIQHSGIEEVFDIVASRGIAALHLWHRTVPQGHIEEVA